MSLKILLIDDDVYNNKVIHKLILSVNKDAECTFYENSYSGLEYLKSLDSKSGNWPDIIFLDVQMPVFDGWDFLDMFQSLSKKASKESKIYVLTSSKDFDTKIKMAQYPFLKGIIHKPITVTELSDIL